MARPRSRPRAARISPMRSSENKNAARPLIIFSRGLSDRAGGVEIFNANLVRALDGKTRVLVPASSAKSLLGNYADRIVQTARLLRSNTDADVLVQYGSFLDILVLPVLRIFSSRINVIAHVSDSWKHVKNPFLFAFSKRLLSSCTRQLFVLADQQASVFADVEPQKIHTIVGSAFAVKPTGQRGSDFVFLGRIVPEKGVFDLLEAWSDRRIVERGLRLRLHGGGDQATLDRVRADIAAKGISHLVELGAPLKGEEAVIEAMDRAKALLYPTYADAFPLVMIESFARGTPCLVSTVGEGISFVSNADLVVRPGDVEAIIAAVLRLAESGVEESYLQTMREKSKRYARGAIVDDLVSHGAISIGEQA